MKSTSIKIIGAFIITGLAVGGYFYLNSTPSDSAVIAETVLVEKGSIAQTITATGTVQPITQVEVGTQVSGVVEKVYVDYNSEVKKGQLIAELDKTNLLTTVAEGKINLQTAQNELDYLQLLFDRKAALYEADNGTKADYDEALYQLEAAKNTLAQRQSELQRAQTNLGYANIYSPIAGVVLSKDVNVGQTVAASFSTPTLFTIAQDLSKMQVEADVDEADVGGVQPGQRVAFTVDAFPGETFDGTVTQLRLNPTTTSNVVTYTVVIKADNPDLKLLPGLTATITIYTYEQNDVLTLAAKAINFTPDQGLIQAYNRQSSMADSTLQAAPINPPMAVPAALVEQEQQASKTIWVKDGQQIRSIQISVGRSDGIKVEVLSGLQEGDEVVFKLAAKTAATTAPAAQEEASSPFMPKPPGSRKK